VKDKITVTIRDDKHEYSEIIKDEDLNNLMEEFEECKNNGANPQLEKITFEEYTRDISFNWNKENMYNLNGNHFIFGWLECFEQLDDIVVRWMYKPETLFVSVTKGN